MIFWSLYSYGIIAADAWGSQFICRLWRLLAEKVEKESCEKSIKGKGKGFP